MRRDENLRCVLLPRGVLAQLLGQHLQQLVVETVLRLLDTDERRRLRILQHDQVGKDLERTVGHLLRIEGIVESPVVEPKQQSPIRALLRIDSVDAWDPPGNSIQDALESVGLFPLHELHDVAKVVAVHVQVLLRAGQWKTSGGIRSEVAQVPSFHEPPEGRYPGMLLQGSKSRDAELAPVLKLDDLRFHTLLSGHSPLDPINQRFQFGYTPMGFIEPPALRLSLPR